MRIRYAPAVGAAGAGLIAGCSSSASSPPAPQKTHSVQAASRPSPVATSPAANPAANERLFVDALSASIPVVPSRVVTGSLMRAYARYQHASKAAWAAVGQPYSGESVTRVVGGYKMCAPATSSNGPGCDTFTQFTTNSAGQITGASVNGQPIAGRIATASAATSDGLTISGVVAYRVTDAQNEVAVAFKLTDTGYKPINTSPSLLTSLSGASDDTSLDALPANLAPGDRLDAEAGFDVPQIDGLFCLEPNDGSGEHLPCTTLSTTH